MHRRIHRSAVTYAAVTLISIVVTSSAQQGGGDGQGLLPSGGPRILGTGGRRLQVSAVAGFTYPWALTFLPNSDILVTERPGRLRIVRGGVLDPQPIRGIPQVLATRFQGLWDIALHPRFEDNRLVYFTYARANPQEVTPDGRYPEEPSGAAVLMRARFDGTNTLSDIRELFASNTWISGATAARIAFGRDEKLYMSIGSPSRDREHGGPNRVGSAESAQDPGSDAGKILRFNDDGSIPSDNPFVHRSGYRPGIYALGVRNPLALIIHPVTGELMDAEHGPNGGDEINYIKAGANYGWPIVSYGRAYTGEIVQSGSGPELTEPCAPGMEQPFLFWTPSIMPGGMTIYTGDKFLQWKGHIFVGGLQTRQLHHVVLNNRGLPTRRESLLSELGQRIREIRQGPDSLLYLLTDAEAGALLKLEPVDQQ